MSFLKKLFGGGGSRGGEKQGEAVTHEGYTIKPVTMPAEGGQFRLCALIEKEIDGETKTHRMIRADTFSDAAPAHAAAIEKAKVVIREQGDRMFG